MVHRILVVKKKYEIPKCVHYVISVSENSPDIARFCLCVFGLWPPNIQEALGCFLKTFQFSLGNYSLCFGNTFGKMVNSSAFPPTMDEKGAFGCSFTQILSLNNQMELGASAPV